MNRTDWDKCFIWLAAMFPNWNTSAAISAAWHMEIGQTAELTHFKTAVRNLMQRKAKHDNAAFPPGVFEIKSEMEKLAGTAVLPGELVWDTIMVLARRGKTDLSSDLPEAAMIAVRSCGGLRQIGLTDLDRLPWLKKDFLSCYTQAIAHGKCEPIYAINNRQTEALPAPVKQLVTSVIESQSQPEESNAQ